MRNRIIILLIVTLVITALVGCNNQKKADGKKLEIKLGHAMSEGTDASKLISEFAKNVTKKTEGRVTIQDYPNSQLGSETEMLEQLKIGSLASGAIMIGSMQSLDMKLAIEDLPYMWKDIKHARKAYDSKFGEEITKIAKKQGLVKIAFIEWGFRHITNNKKAIVKPEDLKGLSIRVAQTKLRVDTFESMGALPTVLAFSELYGALQQGVVNAQENPLSNIVAANFNEVQKYLSLTGHFYNTAMLMISEKEWNKISDSDKKIIQDESKILVEKVRKSNDEKEAEYIKHLKDKGMKVNDDVDKEAFRKATKSVYEKWEKDVFGKELMDVYRKASGWEK